MPEITDKALQKLSPKDTVEAVFDKMGGVDQMVDWAKKNPSTFYVNLYGKLVAQPIDLNIKGGFRIDLPWLVSRPGRPPIVLEHEGSNNAGADTDAGAEPLQVRAEAPVHSPPQPDPADGVRRLPPKVRQDRSSGK